MRLAILSAIHGNLPALERVAAAIAAERPDATVCLGDVIGYGPDPVACIAFVRSQGWPTVLGNHEAYVLEPQRIEEYNPYAKAGAYFTLGALGTQERAWIRSLPRRLEIGGIELVHATPADPVGFPYLTSLEDAAAAFAAASGSCTAIGHSCVPVVFYDGTPITYARTAVQQLPAGGRVLVNVGSVGQPRDGDPRACWVIVDTDARTVHYTRTAYATATVRQRIIDVGLPPLLGDRLLTGQ